MAIIGFPYNSQNRDRAINAETYRRLLSKYFTTGVFPNPSTQFQVFSSSGMALTVKAGSANINGVYVEMESDDSVTIETASSQPRIDRVVLKHDDSTEVRATNLVVKKGTPSSNPQAPTLERNATVYEIALADVRVNANASSINQGNISDLRLKTDLCGIVSATIQSIETDTFYAQMNYEFNTWFEGVKTALGEDVAGNLLNLINEIKRDYIPKSYIVNDLSIGGTDKVLSAEQGKILNEKVIGLNSTISPLSKIYNGAKTLSLNSGSGTYNLLSKSQLCSALGISESSFNQNNLCGYVINASHGVNNARFDLNYNYLTNNLVLSYDNATQGSCAITYVLMYFKSASTFSAKAMNIEEDYIEVMPNQAEYDYTFGKNYKYNDVKYHCLDVNSITPSESYGKTFTSKFTPDMLVGRFFEVVA